MKITALPNKIIGEMMNPPGLFRKKGALFIKDKDGDTSGIGPRWFRVHSVGEGIDWVNEGQYLFVAHGRWSQGMKINDQLKLHLLDNEECLMVSDECPEDM